MNPDILNDQLLFQQTYGHGVLPYPQIPGEAVQERRRRLVTEEMFEEFKTSWEALNNLGRVPKDDPARQELENEALAQFGDAIADALYVLIGTAYEYGIPLHLIWKAVQEANMSKLWTMQEVRAAQAQPEKANWKVKPSPAHRIKEILEHRRQYIVYDQYGKVQKPPSWRAPDIKTIIKEAKDVWDSQRISLTCGTTPQEEKQRAIWNKALESLPDSKPYPVVKDNADETP